jgi:predicted AlkP superfamily pyrophosphatase or phosphodiesterase
MGQGDTISRRRLLAVLAACGLGATSIDLLFGPLGRSSSGDADTTLPDAPLFLCLIVLDGFRPDYRALAPMPSLDALSTNGVSYDRAWVGQLESETPSGHATLTSGAYPRHDGVIGFEWRDPVTRREVLDGWELTNQIGQIGRDMRHVHAHSIPEAIKAARPGATTVSLSSEKIYAADALAAGAADYAFYHHQVGRKLVPRTVPGSAAPPELLSNPDLSLPLPLERLTDWDMLSGRLARAALTSVRPDVMMVNLPGSDYYGHKFGALDSPRIMAGVVAGQDKQIGDIVQAYREAGMFEQTLFVITADHGMVPNHREMTPSMMAAAGQETGAEFLFHTGGTAKYVYLTEKSQTRARAVAAAVARLPNVVTAYHRTSGGHYESAGPRLDPVLDGAYRYLMSTFAGLAAPDVIAPYRENTVGSAYTSLYGNHGGMSWGVQHVPLIISGPGVRRGIRSKAPARLVDVAPTVMRLLGIPLPSADGIVLADALQKPTIAELSAQVRLVPSLALHQEALREQAVEEIRQDRKAGIVPRPRVPVTA